MKFRVTMKEPDCLYEPVYDAVNETVKDMTGDAEEREAVAEMRAEKVRELCSKWFRHGEYLEVEIDTDAKTCTVVEAK